MLKTVSPAGRAAVYPSVSKAAKVSALKAWRLKVRSGLMLLLSRAADFSVELNVISSPLNTQIKEEWDA